MVDQECGPARNPPHSASIDTRLHIGNSVNLMHAADDTGDVSHRPNVYVTDVPRDYSVTISIAYSRPISWTGLRARTKLTDEVAVGVPPNTKTVMQITAGIITPDTSPPQLHTHFSL